MSVCFTVLFLFYVFFAFLADEMQFNSSAV